VRASRSWADYLCSQADAILACDFFETVTLSAARLYVFAVIEHPSRRIRILGATFTRPRYGWRKPRGTQSWTSRTPTAGQGS
jgi:hypothetical protein